MSDEWELIEFAPKNGIDVDLFVPDEDGGYRIPDCHWRADADEGNGLWRDAHGSYRHEKPTHFMLTPGKPEPEKSKPINCCKKGRRSINGGCKNCGDPSF